MALQALGATLVTAFLREAAAEDLLQRGGHVLEVGVVVAQLALHAALDVGPR